MLVFIKKKTKTRNKSNQDFDWNYFEAVGQFGEK
jgi:hypothetical protein